MLKIGCMASNSESSKISYEMVESFFVMFVSLDLSTLLELGVLSPVKENGVALGDDVGV